MHTEALVAVKRLLGGLPVHGAKVLELGSYNVNGSTRPLVEELGAKSYVGLDIREGPGVDVVGNAENWTGGSGNAKPPFDLIISAETLEHVKKPEAVIQNAASLLKPSGWLIVTAAGPERTPHSCDGAAVIPKGEHYENIAPEELGAWFEAGGWVNVTIQHNPNVGDVYARAQRPAADVKINDTTTTAEAPAEAAAAEAPTEAARSK